ncbi:hypothetical protein Cni_G22885 [Canna indica]|uniref:Uncharacterized protein n=1 Tax=Canna indica TaxID=4628 RepID=A0AAQ3KTE7_9LILI|nr:hypothetical protein Cni_G22885 [Canna indica]
MHRPAAQRRRARRLWKLRRRARLLRLRRQRPQRLRRAPGRLVLLLRRPQLRQPRQLLQVRQLQGRLRGRRRRQRQRRLRRRRRRAALPGLRLRRRALRVEIWRLDLQQVGLQRA